MSLGSNAPPDGAVSRKKATCWPGRAANGTRNVSVPWPLTDPAGTIFVPAAEQVGGVGVGRLGPGLDLPAGVREGAEGHRLDFGGDDRAVRGIVADRDAREVVHRAGRRPRRRVEAASPEEEALRRAAERR